MKTEEEEKHYPLSEGERRDIWRGAGRGECSELRGEVGDAGDMEIEMKRDAEKEETGTREGRVTTGRHCQAPQDFPT